MLPLWQDCSRVLERELTPQQFCFRMQCIVLVSISEGRQIDTTTQYYQS